MKKLLLSLFIITFSFCEGQSWVWARQGINQNRSSIADVVSLERDSSGNIYEEGIFYGNILFDTILAVENSGFNLFIAKYDQNGNVSWVRKGNLVNPPNCSIYENGSTLDNSGNIYSTGYYQKEISFGSDTLSNLSLYANAFIVKCDQNGTPIWAKGGVLSSPNCVAAGYDVKTDKLNDVYQAGYFHDTISFDTLALVSSAIQDDDFLVKYNSAGSPLWAKSAEVSGSHDCCALAINTDTKDNVLLSGFFSRSVIFGNDTLNSNKAYNTFLVKYDSTGNVVWANGIETDEDSTIAVWSSIVTDEFDNTYLTASFKDTIKLGSYTLTTQGYRGDVFLAKFNSQGNILWAVSGKIPKSDIDQVVGYSVTLDKHNHIYLSGTFQDTLTFGTIKLFSDSLFPAFLIQFDTSGKALCGTVINNYNDDNTPIISDLSGDHIYIGADLFYYTDCIFGSDTVKGFGGAGPEAAFLAKWQPCPTSTEGISTNTTSSSSISLFPNPNTGKFFLRIENEKLNAESAEVFNVLGERVFKTSPLAPVRTGHPGGPLLGKGEGMEIDLSAQPAGVYFYRVLDEAGTQVGSGKFVIAK